MRVVRPAGAVVVASRPCLVAAANYELDVAVRVASDRGVAALILAGADRLPVTVKTLADRAGLGIYGVLSYSVARRTQEIGIRMALGASSGRVQREVMGHALRLALIGLVAGGAAALAVAQAIRALLYDTAPGDLFTYTATFALVAAAALLAAWLPARRAAHTPPATALRGS